MTTEYITLEELMLCPEFEGLPDEVAQNMLEYLREFCAILSATCLERIAEEHIPEQITKLPDE